MLTRRASVVFGVADLLTAALVLFGVFVALPSRFWPVDALGGALGALELASAVGLLSGASWARALASLAATVTLVAGLALVTALSLTASWLSGVYGPVGSGGATILVLVSALALPYLVVLPATKLFFVRATRTGS
jgi:hypothetical protein